MHYIKNSFRASAFRRAGIVFILAYLSLFVAGGMAIYTIMQRSEENIFAFIIILGVTLLLWIITLIIPATCRCQLCQASTMRSLRCTHHKKARRLLGSYRLRIAVAILFKGSFRCSYCGEAFSLKPKPPKATDLDSPSPERTSSRRSGQIPTRRF